MAVSVSAAMIIPAPTDPHVFGGNELDRAAQLRRDDDAIAALRAHDDARFLPFWDLRGLIDVEGPPLLAWQKMSGLKWLVDNEAELIFLGFEDGAARFAIGLRGDDNPAKGGPLEGRGSFIDVRTIAPQLPLGDAAILAQARAVIDWHNRHKYCAACGEHSDIASAGNTRVCPACNNEHFPRTDPVAIMLVVKDGKCLLGRKREWPPGMYSALAGFIEPGETIEEAVRREVFEEAGILTGDVRYSSSQPWPFPSSLMMGCIAEGLSDEIVIDTDELEDAAWFTRAEIIEGMERVLTTEPGDGKFRMPNPIAIAHQLTCAWLAETEDD